MSSLTQCIKPIKGGRSGTIAVIRDRLTEEADMTVLYGSTPVAELAEVLAGPGRDTFSLCVGDRDEQMRAMADAPDIAWSPGGTATEDAAAVCEWLVNNGNNNIESVASSVLVPLPKSFSLAAAGDEELRRALMAAMPEVAEAYLDAFRSSAVVRIHDRSKPAGEQETFEKAKAIRAWGVGHAISGGGDPHLHLHLLVGMRAEGESGRFGQIYQPQMLKEAGRLAHGAAMHRFREIVVAHGYALDETGEIAGIGERADLIEKSSRAQTSIHTLQAALATNGIYLDHDTAWKQWRQLRNGQHVKGLPAETEREIKQLIGDGRSAEALEHVLDEAVSDGAKRRMLVEHWGAEYGCDLVQVAAKARQEASRAPQLTDVDRLVCMVATSNRAPNIATVRGYAATVAGLAGCDELMVRAAADMRILAGERTWATVSRAEMEASIITRTQALVPHREMSAEAALARTDIALGCISGVAGAGKSHRLMAAGEVWRHEGRRVYATARNTLTAHETAAALGCKSWSVTGLRMRQEREPILAAGDVLVVDEAGLLDAADIELFLGLAEKGVIVKMLGDDRQLSSIDGSTAARLMLETARKHGQPYLDTTVRCQAWADAHDALRRSVAEPNRENIESTISALNIVPITDIGGALAIGEGEYITATNASRSLLAAQIKRPPEPANEAEIVRVRDDEAAWLGDRVIIRKNIWRPGGIEVADNGDIGVINRINSDTVTVSRERDGELITIARKDAPEILALGGAWTADSAQGQTFDAATVVVTGQEAGEWLYSAATRSRAVPTIAVVVGEVELPPRMEQALAGTPEHELAMKQERHRRAAEIVRGTLARSQTDHSCIELAAGDEAFRRQAAEKVPQILALGEVMRSADERELQAEWEREVEVSREAARVEAARQEAAREQAARQEARAQTRAAREQAARQALEDRLAERRQLLEDRLAEEVTKLAEWQAELTKAQDTLTKAGAELVQATDKAAEARARAKVAEAEFRALGRFVRPTTRAEKEKEMRVTALKANEAWSGKLDAEKRLSEAQYRVAERGWGSPAYEVKWAQGKRIPRAQEAISTQPEYERKQRAALEDRLAKERTKEDKRWALADERQAKLQAAPTEAARDELLQRWEAERKAAERLAAERQAEKEVVRRDDGYGLSL